MATLLAGLPTWAVYAAVGAVLGGLFAGIGYFIERAGFRPGRYAVIIGIAITAPVTERLVLPSLQPILQCGYAEQAQRRTPIGVELDAYTTFTAMRVDCANRAVVYDMAVALASTELADPAAWEIVEEDFRQGQCTNTFWRAYINDGWTIQNQYTLTDGMQRTVEARC